MDNLLRALCMGQRLVCGGGGDIKNYVDMTQEQLLLEKIYLEVSEQGDMVDAMLSCNPARQNIIIFMACMMTVNYLAQHAVFFRHIINENWNAASREIEKSKWGQNHVAQASFCCRVMKSGIWSMPVCACYPEIADDVTSF